METTFTLEKDILLLDGKPVDIGQIIYSQYGKGEVLPGRITFNKETGWGIAYEEFIGHTYLNIPLDEAHISDLIVTVPYENPYVATLVSEFGIG